MAFAGKSHAEHFDGATFHAAFQFAFELPAAQAVKNVPIMMPCLADTRMCAGLCGRARGVCPDRVGRICFSRFCAHPRRHEQAGLCLRRAQPARPRGTARSGIYCVCPGQAPGALPAEALKGAPHLG